MSEASEEWSCVIEDRVCKMLSIQYTSFAPQWFSEHVIDVL
jgi:hypothetical protein